MLFIALLLTGWLLAGYQQEAPAVAGDGGTLNLYGVDPLTLDPAVSNDMTSHSYVKQIFSGLVRLDEDLEPVPDIAERWELSDDGRTYTFYLREDVKFHDGRQVTAADFKYSWERACDPATGSQAARTHLGDIVGVEEKLSGEAGEISGVKVIDDFTLRVTIDAPKSYFLFKLTYPVALVVDRDDAESGEGWWRQPNGTGPFKVAGWEEEEELVLERNDHYYGRTAGVERVVYSLWSGVPMNMYETGQIDVAGVSVSYIDIVTDPSGPFHSDLQVSPELSFTYLGFDATRPPFDDRNVRRAFARAIDKEKLTSLVFRDLVQSAYGILPPGMPGYNPDLDGLEFSVEKAKEAIADSGYGSVSNLPPITITTSGYGGVVSSSLEAIVEEWRRNLGVEVSIRQLEPQHYIYNLKEERDEMFYLGWVADYPHPQDFLEVLFGTGNQHNYGDFSNAEIDALLEKAALEQDYDESLGMYRRAEQMLVDDAACIPLWFGQNYTLVKPHVEGYELNPMGFAMLNRVSIEE